MLDSVPSFCDRPPAIGNPESLGLETSPGHVELSIKRRDRHCIYHSRQPALRIYIAKSTIRKASIPRHRDLVRRQSNKAFTSDSSPFVPDLRNILQGLERERESLDSKSSGAEALID